jgi:hypothetical protein
MRHPRAHSVPPHAHTRHFARFSKYLLAGTFRGKSGPWEALPCPDAKIYARLQCDFALLFG